MSEPSTPPPDATYPSHWEADVLLRDGAPAHVRPMRGDDTGAVTRFHARQSDESIYFRFFAPLRELSEKDLYRFTHLDYSERVAIVCTIGGEIVGIARYDRITPVEAEVAFNISDAHHGRGVGSVLLEHLAAAARENGVTHFVADVLPNNRKMLAVFRDAGYEVRHALEDGVISLSFTIGLTEKSLAVMESREHRSEAKSLQVLLNPETIVVAGVSRREGTIGHRLITSLRAGGFTGRLMAVHPEADSVHGVPAVRRLADIEGAIELLVVAVPAGGVLELVAEAAARGVRGLVICSGGFAEDGPQGAERQRELVALARANGLRIVGPNSWGVINTDPEVRLNVTLAERPPQAGRLGLFCQSGALSVSVLDALERRGLGVSTFVSAGNRADVSGNDCLQYWDEDGRTSVVGLYLESIGNPRKFSRIARRISRHKPVIVLKSGSAGFGSPPGHTVRRSRVPREVADAMIRQSGCLRVDSVRQMFDVADLLLHQPLPLNASVAIVTNSTALGALLADACSAAQLRVVHGPVNLSPQADASQFREAIDEALAAPMVGSLITAFMPPLATHAAEVARGLSEASAGAEVPVLGCFLGGEQLREHLRVGRPIPAYTSPEDAVSALATVTHYAQWLARDPGDPLVPPGQDAPSASALIEAALTAHPEGVDLTPARSAELLATYGVECWPEVAVHSPEEAVAAGERLGWPVVLKSTAAHLRHRVDLGGVRLDLGGADSLREAFEAMLTNLAPLGGGQFVVQKMAPAGVACVVRTAEDPLFGPVVTFGLAGDASELLGDVAHRIPPLSAQDVLDLITSVKASPRLTGHRGAEPVNVGALEELVARVSCLAYEHPEIAGLEINPVVVSATGAAVVGVGIRLAPSQARADAGRRELTAVE